MYYQFDSRLNLPAIMFDDDRIVVAGKEYFYTELKDVEISKAPLLATYGIMELKTGEKSIPVPFAKADIHRLRTAIQEARHLIQTYAQRKATAEAPQMNQIGQAPVQASASLSGTKETVENAGITGAAENAGITGATEKAGIAESTEGAAGQTAGACFESTEGATGQAAGDSFRAGGAAETAAQAFYSQPRQNYALDPYEEMKKLKELLDLDIITQEEFTRKKKELLGL